MDLDDESPAAAIFIMITAVQILSLQLVLENGGCFRYSKSYVVPYAKYVNGGYVFIHTEL